MSGWPHPVLSEDFETQQVSLRTHAAKQTAHLKLVSPSNGDKSNSALPSTPSTATPASLAQSSPVSSLAYPDSPSPNDKEHVNDGQVHDSFVDKHDAITCGALLNNEIQRLTQLLSIGVFGPGGPDAHQRKAMRRQLGKLQRLRSCNWRAPPSLEDDLAMMTNCERSCSSLDKEIQHLVELLEVGLFGFGGPDEKQSTATRERLGELRTLQSRICFKHAAQIENGKNYSNDYEVFRNVQDDEVSRHLACLFNNVALSRQGLALRDLRKHVAFSRLFENTGLVREWRTRPSVCTAVMNLELAVKRIAFNRLFSIADLSVSKDRARVDLEMAMKRVALKRLLKNAKSCSEDTDKKTAKEDPFYVRPSVGSWQSQVAQAAATPHEEGVADAPNDESFHLRPSVGSWLLEMEVKAGDVPNDESFHLRPSVGSWLQDMEEKATATPNENSFDLRPSVGSWLMWATPEETPKVDWSSRRVDRSHSKLRQALKVEQAEGRHIDAMKKQLKKAAVVKALLSAAFKD